MRYKYPKRIVIPTPYCPYDTFYYFSKDGHVRQVDLLKDWIMICDYDRGFPWMKRVR